MVNKILVRGLDPEVLQALESMASGSERSLEAEARYALRSWVQRTQAAKEQSARRHQLAQRLSSSLAQVNAAVSHLDLRPSHVAQGIGEPLAEPVENWFIGQAEPTFDQLVRIADFLGLSAGWLQHGDGRPFPVDYLRLSEDPANAVRWLLNLPEDPAHPLGTHQPPPLPGDLKRLVLVRSDSESGALAIIKQRDDYRCVTYTTPTHVSHVIGNGGEAQLRALSVTMELLYKIYTKKTSMMVKSWIVPERDFSALVSGQVHPLALDDGRVDRPWWEDFWDAGMAEKNEYWKGWREITASIRRSIDSHTFLSQQRTQIREGVHPMLT